MASFFSPPPPPPLISLRPEQEGRAAVIWVASNCAPARQAFVASLMQHIAVDSYGKCLHNAEFPAHEERVFGSTKLPLFARYQFALALENSLAHDYVTEKFYQPLIAGAVPIYLGVSLSLSLALSLSLSFVGRRGG